MPANVNLTLKTPASPRFFHPISASCGEHSTKRKYSLYKGLRCRYAVCYAKQQRLTQKIAASAAYGNNFTTACTTQAQ
jgi:hypothetical protein